MSTIIYYVISFVLLFIVNYAPSRKALVRGIIRAAQFICPHDWKKVGTEYDEIRHECTNCKAIGWRYSDDVPYETYLERRQEEEPERYSYTTMFNGD